MSTCNIIMWTCDLFMSTCTIIMLTCTLSIFVKNYFFLRINFLINAIIWHNTCHMQHNYVQMRLIYVNMKHNYAMHVCKSSTCLVKTDFVHYLKCTPSVKSCAWLCNLYYHGFSIEELNCNCVPIRTLHKCYIFYNTSASKVLSRYYITGNWFFFL